MKARNKIFITLTGPLLSLWIGCGGANKSSGAGSLPSEDNGRRAERNKSTGGNTSLEARGVDSQFADAVAYFQEREKTGWDESGCREAASRFEKVVNEGSVRVEAYYNKGLSFQRCGMESEAEENYKKTLAEKSDHGPALANLGQIYFRRGDQVRAKEFWEKALEADGRTVAARNNLAWLMIRDIRDGNASLKSLEEPAKRHLQRALAVDNDNVEAYTLLGLLYMQGSERNKSRLTLAKLLLEKGSEIDSNYAPLHNATGLLLLLQDNVPNALESFRKATSLDPQFVEAHKNLGNILLDFRKYEEAKSEFETVLAEETKDYDAYIGLGYALRGIKDFDAAENAYLAAREIDGTRAEADYNLGVLYQDFRASGTDDLRVSKAAFQEAQGYFAAAMKKPKASSQLKKDARANAKVCEKNVASLAQSIAFDENAKNDQ